MLWSCFDAQRKSQTAAMRTRQHPERQSPDPVQPAAVDLDTDTDTEDFRLAKRLRTALGCARTSVLQAPSQSAADPDCLDTDEDGELRTHSKGQAELEQDHLTQKLCRAARLAVAAYT